MAIERTRVRHEDPQQFHGSSGAAKHADVEWPQCAGLIGVAEARRQRPNGLRGSFAILGGEGHEDIQLLGQLQLPQHCILSVRDPGENGRTKPEMLGWDSAVIPSEPSGESRDLACDTRGLPQVHHSRSLDCADAPLGMTIRSGSQQTTLL